MAIFDKVGKTFSRTSQEVVQKGKKFADITKYNSAINDMENQICQLNQLIGNKYVEMHGDSPEAELCNWVNEIKSLRENINDYAERIKTLKGIRVCPNCGMEVEENARFCGYCGNVIEEMHTPSLHMSGTMICAKCGAPLDADMRFCAECGERVK